MSKQKNDKMSILKKVFFVLLVLDAISLILAVVGMIPTFRTLAGYGAIMLIVGCVMIAMTVAVKVVEILAKAFLIRSTSPAFSHPSGYSGCKVWAVLLLVFNAVSIIISMLSTGGEGATMVNQGRLCLQMLASAAEIITVAFYLHAIKKRNA